MHAFLPKDEELARRYTQATIYPPDLYPAMSTMVQSEECREQTGLASKGEEKLVSSSVSRVRGRETKSEKRKPQPTHAPSLPPAREKKKKKNQRDQPPFL